MDVLWGAWIKQLDYDEGLHYINIIGIYDIIDKWRKSDYPFTTDLKVVLACQGYPSEYGHQKEISLVMWDIDATELYSQSFSLEVPTLFGESKVRWYETYELSGIVFGAPGYYELGILVNGEEKQNIPLQIMSGKMVDLDKFIKHDIYEERWFEDKDLEV